MLHTDSTSAKEVICMRKRILIAAVALALVVGVAATANAASTRSPRKTRGRAMGAPVKPASETNSSVVTITGTVTSGSGNEYTLDSEGKSVPVEFGPRWFKAVDLTVGDVVTVTGEWDTGRDGKSAPTLDAFSVTHDGVTTVVRQGPGKPPWAGKGGPKGRGGADD
jgi:uncharacterized protein YdeI (BOF family)